MRECWAHQPAARLTALRVKKTLGKLMEKLEESKRVQVKNLKLQQLYEIITSNEKDKLVSPPTSTSAMT